jgi:hypothetical protein
MTIIHRFSVILAATATVASATVITAAVITTAVITTAVIITAAPALAQDGADIYLATLKAKDDLVKIGTPKNITNRPGYDNQPSFTADGTRILFTSIRDDQADIYQYDPQTETVSQVTRTAESEFSPTPIPGMTDFSVVRVEADSAQRLWAFTGDGTAAKLLLADAGPVGYHAWGDDPDHVAIFVLGEPHYLQLANLRRMPLVTVATDIGRSLQKIPGKPAISFTQKRGEMWWVDELDLASRKTRPLIQAVPGSEDCAWTPDGVLLMAKGTTVYACRPGASEWAEVARFDDLAMGPVTRLAVSPKGDRLALVAGEPAPDEE